MKAVLLTIIVLSLIAIVLVGIDPLELLGQKEQSLKKFENLGYGLSLLHPQKWGNGTSRCVLEWKTCTLSFAFSPNGTTVGPNEGRTLDRGYFIKIEVIQLNEPSEVSSACNCTALKDFVAWDYTGFYDNGWTYINDNQTHVGNNYSAWQTEMLYGGLGKRYLFVHTLNGNSGYIFTYSGPSDNEFDRYLNEFKNMLKSVNLIDQLPERKPSFLN